MLQIQQREKKMKKLLTLLLCIVLAASIFMFSACDKDKGEKNGEDASYTKEDVEKMFEQIFTCVFKNNRMIVTYFEYIGGDIDGSDPGCIWRIGFGPCYISKYKSTDYAEKALASYKQEFEENKGHYGQNVNLEHIYFEQHGEYIEWGQNKFVWEAVRSTEPDLSGIPTKLKTEYKNCINEMLSNATYSILDARFNNGEGLFSITYYIDDIETKEILWLADENNQEAKSRYEESKKSPGATDMGDNVLIITQAN
jgi:lipoprotein